MKIKTQLMIVTGFFGVMLFVIAALMISNAERSRSLIEHERLARSVEHGTGNLGYLSSDYMLHGERQLQTRWQSRFAAVSGDLSRLASDSPECRPFVGQMRENLRNMAEVFGEIESAYAGNLPTRDGAALLAYIQASWSRMAVQVQELLAVAARLSRQLHNEAEQLRQTRDILIFALIGWLAAFLVAHFFLTYRRMLKSVSALQAGTRIIGSGNLDFRIEERKNDEIGDLSRAFNQMAANLKEVTASKADLELEMGERRRAEEGLRESEARYRSLFNGMTEGFALHELITDTEGKPCDYRFLEINPAFERLTGLRRDAAIGKTVREVIPDIEAYWIETYGRVALEGIPVHVENYSAPLNRWYEAFAYRSAPGKFAVVFMDITERKHAEESLRESRARLKAALASMTDAVFISDTEGRFVELNDAFASFHKFSKKDECPKTLTEYADILDVFMADGTLAPLDMWTVPRALRGETATNAEYYLRRKDSGETWVGSYSFGPIRDKSGAVIGSVVVARDVSDRKRAEVQLRRLSQFPEENPNPVLRVAGDGALLYANDSARQWLATFGEPAGETLPLPVQAAVTEARGQDRAVEAEITNPAGRTFNFFAVQPPREDYVNLYGMDFTERKQAEEALRESEERIRASLAEKEVLLKEIHHRVKNNMQVISSLVALQAAELGDAAMRSVLGDVTHRVRSMALVHEKLYQSADLARVEFAEYAKSLLNYLWRSYGRAAAGIRLTLDMEPVSLSVNAAVPCGLILNELVTNALKHAFSGSSDGELTVSLGAAPPGRVRLCVRDNGRGLPEGLDWRKARSLGLRLVQMLAGQLHAEVQVKSDAGTEFVITFGMMNDE